MIRKTKILFVSALLSLIALSSLIGKPVAMQNIKSGTWGGEGIALDVEDGSATVEYDCANGKINGPLKLDDKGQFVLSGTHVREHGGPIRRDEVRTGLAATYSGCTDGKRMTLRVTLTNSKEVVGDYELEYGRTGRIRKCG
jgi:hypothetical protein